MEGQNGILYKMQKQAIRKSTKLEELYRQKKTEPTETFQTPINILEWQPLKFLAYNKHNPRTIDQRWETDLIKCE